MADEIESGGSRGAAMPPTGETPGAGAGEAGSESATRTAKEQAQAVWSDTRENVRQAVAQQQQAAAAEAGEVAGALRTAAQQLDGQQKATAASLVRHAAEGLERVAGNLRDKDLDTMVRDVERLARREPGLFLGAAVIAGFLAVRFLKSSSERAEGGHEAGFAGHESPPEGGHLH